MAHVHSSVNDMSRHYLTNDRRFNYTTPKTFLGLISLYSKLLSTKHKELQGKIERLQNGLEKLRTTSSQVDALKAKLAVQEVELQKKNDEADKLIKIVEAETEKVSIENEMANEEKRKVAIIEAEVSKRQLKSFGSPPSGVSNVTAAVMVLLSQNGKIPKDRSWKTAKVMMAKVDQFLDQLTNYNKEDIHPDVIKALQPYLEDPDFNPDFIRSKSVAAAGVLDTGTIRLLYTFHLVLRDSLEAQLAELQAQYEKATAEKVKCQMEADATTVTIQLANRLVGGLSSEKVRWAEAVAELRNCEKTLPGDILIAAAFISYVGCFTKHYRKELMDKMWLPSLSKYSVHPIKLLTDDATIARWNNEGLPSDKMSTENAIILTNSDRWPLLIDPQLQGIKWIKAKYGEMLRAVRLDQKNCLEVIESAILKGETVLIESIPENLDPVLDPLIGKNLIKKGQALKLGDREIEYNQDFQLILQTKLANPHYKPELQAQCTLINFTVTRDGLEDQLLAEVVKAERPDLEELKFKLTKQQNDFKIELKQLEDDLLSRLSSAAGNFLGDTALVENLEHTKATAQEIQEKVSEARVTSQKIDEARELYRPAASRASLLYFILNDLHKINPIYQFSLKAFRVVFHKAIERAEVKDDVDGRVKALINTITYSVFQYTTRGLFEKDKLIFSAQMTFQILSAKGEIGGLELDYLLRFPTTPNVVSPLGFISNNSWGSIRSLSQVDEFRNLDREIEGNPKRWRVFCESEAPEKEKLPGDWKNKTDVQQLCIMRAVRPDRMTHAIHWLPRLEKKLDQNALSAHTDYRVFMSAEPANKPENHILPQGILESAIKITNEPPRGMQANLHKALSNFNQDTLEMCSRENEFKSLLFSLCYFHACVAERRKFGAQGWNRPYPFNTGDLTISVNVLLNYLEANSQVPWEDLRYLFGEIMYGGHITDDWDRRLCRTYLEEFLHPNQLDGELMLAPGFCSPPNQDYVGYHNYIDTMLPPESPHLYGLHPNAEIGFLTMTSEQLFKTVFELQPRDMGGSGGVVITREDKVKQTLDEIVDKLPEPFNMTDIMSKVEERTPYVVVAFQECERMNVLTKTIRTSLKELDLGFKGELKMTPAMEELVNSLFLDQVPESWVKLAYASTNGLNRLLPSTVWLAGFFNPQSFLTAIMQSTARNSPPREGAYIHGLYLEGASWDIENSILVDSKLKDLYPQMPVFHIKAITQDKCESRNIYECPMYKTRQRGPTYVWTLGLKTKEKPSKWVLGGVALLLQV
ncbi:Dynein beta chain, ciliary [Armadillidium nasatum]|uniref:Dynein beta chain, ciliary n=1 Tax=Armadillidium nasatum TaxID=96803 RepID=A0A5N5SL75_9CRUS|nr:Dynein beta chain, ciliary [Armadillidium nasatum]